ncbi:MAG: CvpA family protein [Oscillospiraceae bacterium]|nr:CvpA family protein [Oscillospiraceae bacterium]
MIRVILDILLLVIVALCTWTGYKRGLIGGVAGILAVLIALFGGSLLSSAYSHEVVPALEPFVDGYIDSQNIRDDVLETLGYGSSDLSLEDILARDSSLRYDYAVECMKIVGLYQDRAEEQARKAVDYADRNGGGMTEAVVATLCDTVTFVAGLTIAFLLILILLVAIGNIGNLSFRLPNMELLDEIGGAVLGFVKGFLYCILLCWLLSFMGIAIGKETLEHTTLAQFFLQIKFLTSGLV